MCVPQEVCMNEMAWDQFFISSWTKKNIENYQSNVAAILPNLALVNI